VSDLITGGQDTVAVRVPSHPAAQALLQAFCDAGGGVVGPSANRFGRVSATTAAHVRSEFGDAVDYVLDGGACDVGIESTIVDVSGAKPALLRPGIITAAQIESALGTTLAIPGAQSPRAPGTLVKHYAPRTPVMLVEGDLIDELARSFARQGKRVAVLARNARQPLIDKLVWIAAPAAPAGYAHDLYASLRQLDAAGCDVMIVEEPPLAMEWAAVRDRLGRAAAGAGAEEDD
jgi:L-threonylcarbamoyladenylate synthase